MTTHLARISVAAMFLINGFAFATWASRIPVIQQQLQLSAGELGTALLGTPVGSLLSLPVAGWLITRFGSKRVTILAAIANCCILPLIALAPSVVWLAVVLFLFGGAGDILNIGMNAQAVVVENQWGKPIMSSFHGLYSTGGMLGAAFGGVMAEAGFAPLEHFVVGTAMGLTVLFIFFKWLVPYDVAADKHKPLFAKPDAVLWWLGLIAFFCMLGEGAMADWSSVFLAEISGTTAGISTLGYTAFSTTMMSGRFLGDRLLQRLGQVQLIRISGFLAGSGMTAALLLATPFWVIVGFAMVGLGLANVVPIVYGAAGRSKMMPAGVAIAAVSTVGYTGFLIGPPVIGWVADFFSLRIALFIVAVLALGMAAAADKARS
ncbi:MAG: MFS transporter [Cytophagales bacterium]|nr:MFS transporter [Bernardetiaceae bacterium]MDW8203751.1 MFS transporter [Cytophagales bacterium]